MIACVLSLSALLLRFYFRVTRFFAKYVDDQDYHREKELSYAAMQYKDDVMVTGNFEGGVDKRLPILKIHQSFWLQV